MKTLIAALLLTNALMAQRGGFGHAGFGGGFRGGGSFRGGFVGSARAPAFHGGFGRGFVGGNFRFGSGRFAGQRFFPRFRYYSTYPAFGFGWPYYGYGFGYGLGFNDWPYWSDYGPYSTGGYSYPYSSGPSVSVITVPSQPSTGPIIITPSSPQQQNLTPDQSTQTGQNPEAVQKTLRSPIYLIAATNGTIWAARSWSVENGRLEFTTVHDERKSLPLAQVDRELTRDLNAQAGHEVRLP